MTAEDENYSQGELSSLAIECKQKNEFNEKDELEALATATKEVYFRIASAFPLRSVFTPLFR